VRFNRKYHGVRAQLVREAVEVAAADGVQVAAFAHFDPAPFVDRSRAAREAAFHILDEIARGQAEGNTKVRTGYWRDIVVRKRKTEIEHITGEIVRCGERHGVPTPLNRLQWTMFEEIENGTRPMQWANLDELDAALPSDARQ
jgi:2-dehydropantoate 2-reductase